MDSSLHGHTLRVVQGYSAVYADPIAFKVGDLLQVGDRDSEWPTFIWCVGPDGRAGWTPEDVIELIGPGQGLARADYSARELTVAVDDLVTIEGAAGGWYWAVDQHGVYGWLPEMCVNGQD